MQDPRWVAVPHLGTATALVTIASLSRRWLLDIIRPRHRGGDYPGGRQSAARRCPLGRCGIARLPRDGPYFWVTWLTKLLAGENSCEWASWFRARHESGSWEQVPGDFDRAGWQMAHTAMVNEVRGRWEELGYQVFTERQNSLRLRGESGTLRGQPDLIVRKGDAGTINDVKTGKPGVVQVVLYMYAVPKAIALHRDVVFDGQVAYADHVVDIPAEAVDDWFVERLAGLVSRLASDLPARRVPSPGECRFCPITAMDCPERADDGEVEQGVTSDF